MQRPLADKGTKKDEKGSKRRVKAALHASDGAGLERRIVSLTGDGNDRGTRLQVHEPSTGAANKVPPPTHFFVVPSRGFKKRRGIRDASPMPCHAMPRPPR
jgi:hypothetical protein